jgi:hypothetical protein
VLSIKNDGRATGAVRPTPTLLSVSAPVIELADAGITAESSQNVDASDIRIQFRDRMLLDPSRVTTSANEGNGGSIRIEGGGPLLLDRSQITTSVSGAVGDGGDIFIHAGALVLNTGFIQANTTGTGARGGNVTIDVPFLIASANQVATGGAVPLAFDPRAFGLNVIQAAAPTGVSGTVKVSVPALDVTGGLQELSAQIVSVGALGKDVCRISARSSLTPVGRGGLRPSSAALIRPEGRSVQAGAGAPRAQPRMLFALLEAAQCR